MRDLGIDDLHAELRRAIDEGRRLSGDAAGSLGWANKRCLAALRLTEHIANGSIVTLDAAIGRAYKNAPARIGLG